MCVAAIEIPFLVADLVALLLKQPYGFWYVLLLPGLLGAVLFPSLYLVVKRRYAEAELRKSRAADM